MKKLIFFFLIIAMQGQAQVNYEVKLMSWNLLNFPSQSNIDTDTTNRCPDYRIVINYVKPDVIITCENTGANSISIFLNQVMNTGSYHYAAGTYVNSYDTDNGIFYRDSLFDFVSNVPVQTALRDINHFTLIFKATGDTLHIFSCHLKASPGFESDREAEINNLRQVTNAFPPGTNFIVGGDFNIYYESEPAYQALLRNNSGDDGNFLDALHLTGTWNNPNYAQYHTQSTRLTGVGGGASGGMNDRFDMLLYSNGVASPTGVYYMPGTYMNIGNDGHHFDQSINYGTNTAVPDSVADALYNTADHLPVAMTLMIGPTSGINDVEEILSELNIFPDPVSDNSRIQLTLKKSSSVSFFVSDAFGRIVHKSEAELLNPGEHFLSFDWKNELNSGFYFLSVKLDNYLISRKIILLR